MLILSRRLDEQVVINPGQPDEVVITVVDIRGDRVRLGVSAAPEIPVHRREVADRIAAEREEGYRDTY